MRVMRPSLPFLLAGVLVVSACPTAVSTTKSATRAPNAAANTSSGACESARLQLAATDVVANVNGQEIKASDLGPELAATEDRALRTYCDALAEARQGALDNKISDALVERAAKQAGQTPQDFVQAKVMLAMSTPIPEEDLRKFYDENKSEQAPPFESVKPQVEAALQRQKVESTVEQLLVDLRKEAKIETHLPDVGPAPFDLTVPAHAATKGAGADAVVTVTEFADFECPYCSRAGETMSALAKRYGDRVRFSYRHFPLSFHPNARRAAEYGHCAQEQGKFWEFHDQTYANQRALDEDSLRSHAASVGVDMEKASECLLSGRAKAAVDEDFKVGQEVGVEGTPSFYINGRSFKGNPTPEGIGAAIETALRAGS